MRNKTLALLLALGLVAAACSGGAATSDNETSQTTTAVGEERNEIRTVASEPATLDPHRVTDSTN